MSQAARVSSEVIVSPVRSRRERNQFVDLPWKLYRDDPNWVPPLRANQRELLGYKKNPFHEHAEVETFLALRAGEVVGRVAAILNHAHNDFHNERRGFFGFFESIDDQEVADSLFDTVREWFAQRDIHDLRGPANPSLLHECGLLIEGFDSPPVFMMTYNPPYYARLIEGWGYRKTHDLLAFIGRAQQIPETRERLAALVAGSQERLNTRIRPLDKSRFVEELESFLEMWNRSLYAMWGFVPVSKAEVRHMAASLKWLLIPELVFMAEADGQTVGCVIAIPDYNPMIKKIDGRLLPFGFLRLMWYKRHVKRLRLIAINILPEYQRWGLGLVLLDHLVPKGLQMGIEECEYSWVSEANTLARKGLIKGGAKHYKTYRMYDWPPPTAATENSETSTA